MWNWITNAVGNFAEWVGSGVASVVEWLLGGLADMFTLIFDAVNSIWSVFESLWNLGSSFISSLLHIFTLFFPFIPEPVAGVISAGMVAVLIAGIVKKVRGK